MLTAQASAHLRSRRATLREAACTAHICRAMLMGDSIAPCAQIYANKYRSTWVSKILLLNLLGKVDSLAAQSATNVPALTETAMEVSGT